MRGRLSALIGVVAVLLASCGGDEPSTVSGQPKAGDPATRFHHIHGLGVDNVGTLYVATHAGLIRGADDRNWSYVGADRNDHMGFTLHPSSGTMFRSGHPVTGGSLGVETSPDGLGWRKLSNVLDPPVDFHAMTVSYGDIKALYGWDSGSQGAFHSSDGGRTWQRLSMMGAAPVVFSFAAPAAVGVVFAGTPSGLFRSQDRGATWRVVSALGTGYVVSVAADPSDPSHVLAFTERGMKYSRDGGSTWSPSLGGIPPSIAATSLAISPVDGQIAYAADAATIFKTSDGGNTWTPIRQGS